MITNHARTVINSFEKLKLPTKEAKPTGSGMMSRSRPTVQDMGNATQNQPALIAKEIYEHIKSANNRNKNGGDDGTIV